MSMSKDSKPPRQIFTSADATTQKRVDYRMKRTIPYKLDFHHWSYSPLCQWNLKESANIFTEERIKELVAGIPQTKVGTLIPFWIITDHTGKVLHDWKQTPKTVTP